MTTPMVISIEAQAPSETFDAQVTSPTTTAQQPPTTFDAEETP